MLMKSFLGNKQMEKKQNKKKWEQDHSRKKNLLDFALRKTMQREEKKNVHTNSKQLFKLTHDVLMVCFDATCTLT